MSKRFVLAGVRCIIVSSVLTLAGPLLAADHEDSPAVRTDPTTDYGDVIAWMSSDASRLHLIGTVVRRATAASRFSDSAQYVFHTRSGQAYGDIEGPVVNIICNFEGVENQTISCWAGRESFVMGDASDPEGIISEDGRLRVFAGLRNDAFFFNANGFNATRGLVINAASSLTFDDAGCPQLDSATSNALVTQLQTLPDGSPAADAFGNANILTLAISVDKSIVTPDGPIVAVWGSTRQRTSALACLGDANVDGEVTVDEIILTVNNALVGCEIPQPPVLGVQIDRMGRSAINTALIGPFLDPGGAGERGALQDVYNAAGDPSQWADMFAAEIASNLAIYDGLDTVCGNQLLAGETVAAGRYDGLAAVLADDRLYVNTASGNCTTYLGVEANALGITNNDCGGRTPLEDTIDVSYSVLATGGLSGVIDGVPIDADGGASLDAFPFYDEPLPLP